MTESPSVAAQRLLVQDAIASWGRGDFSATARTQKWQVLQDASAPITPLVS